MQAVLPQKASKPAKALRSVMTVSWLVRQLVPISVMASLHRVAAAGAKKTAARSGHTRICGGVETIPVLPKGSEIRPTKSKSKATPLLRLFLTGAGIANSK